MLKDRTTAGKIYLYFPTNDDSEVMFIAYFSSKFYYNTPIYGKLTVITIKKILLEKLC